MVIYVYGPDTFRSREKLNELVLEFKRKRDPQGHNVMKLKAPEFSLPQFRNAVTAQGLFSPKRMVVVEGAVTKAATDLQDAIVSQLEQLPLDAAESNAAVFWDEGEGDDPSPPARTVTRTRFQKSKKKKGLGAARLHQLLLAQRYVFYYPRLQAGALSGWVAERARAYGATFAPGSAGVFAQAVGDDLWRADRELQKLAAYCRNGVITSEDISALVEQPGEPPTLFEFLDAFTERKAAPALQALQELIASGTESVALAGQIARSLRVIGQVKSFLEDPSASNKSHIAEELQIHPYVARKATQQSQAFSWGQLLNIEQLALDLDFAIKNSGVADPALPFELFLYRSMLR